MREIKILTFTTLFPNCIQPNNAIFVYNRMASVARHCPVEVKVVNPIPFFPPVERFGKWYPFSQIPSFERINSLDCYHPKYVVTPKLGMSLYGFNMFAGSFHVVKKLFQVYPFDIIDAHYVYPDGLAAVFLGKIFQKPVVISARGTDINLYPKFPLIRWLIRYSLRQANNIISVCTDLKQIMVSLGIPDKKIVVIPNGIDETKFYKLDKKASRAKIGIPCKGKVLLTVGSLIERKGHHILIDSIGLLNERKKLDFHTYIVGEGEWERRLKKQIEKAGLRDRVFLAGQVPNDHLVYWYNAADIFFLGSSREGWPNVVCEALACGIPVVATSANGVPEIINSEEYGIIVDRNIEAFAKGISEAFARDWDYEKIYQYGQQRTWKTVAKEVYDTFCRVVS